jgi:hypothetical protein
MKTKLFFITAFVAALMIITSCEEDPLNLFSDDLRDGITGEWNVDEDSQYYGKKSTANFYTVTINKHSTDTNKILIRNFYSIQNANIEASLDGVSLNIPEQTKNGYVVKGYGTISSDFETIEWAYTVDDQAGTKDNVTATYTR